MKPVECRTVKAGKISRKKGDKRRVSDLRLHIESSSWIFPSRTYRESELKSRLESAICEILDLESVEVKSFFTNILEHD